MEFKYTETYYPGSRKHNTTNDVMNNILNEYSVVFRIKAKLIMQNEVL